MSTLSAGADPYFHLLEYAGRLERNKKYHCPLHDDGTASLSVYKRPNGVWKVHCFAGCTEQKEGIAAVLKAWHPSLRLPHLYPPHMRQSNSPTSSWTPSRNVVETYHYGPDLRKHRCLKTDGTKYFVWQLRDRGRWRDSRKGELPAPGLYKVSELPKEPAVVFVVEGERKVNLLRSWGLHAVCSPHGAGVWQESYSDQLRRHYVVALPDNDTSGGEYGKNAVSGRTAGRSQVCELPGLGPKQDIVDWVRAGHTKSELLDLIGLATCEMCGGPVVPGTRGERRRFCMSAHRLKGWRSRKTVSPSAETVSLPSEAAETVSSDLDDCATKPFHPGPNTVSSDLQPRLLLQEVVPGSPDVVVSESGSAAPGPGSLSAEGVEGGLGGTKPSPVPYEGPTDPTTWEEEEEEEQPIEDLDAEQLDHIYPEKATR